MMRNVLPKHSTEFFLQNTRTTDVTAAATATSIPVTVMTNKIVNIGTPLKSVG